MQWLSGSRSFLGCFAILWLGLSFTDAQDPFGDDVLTSNSQLWKSFQEEMKTLEQAAHRVNSLLSNAAHAKNQEDQETKASEHPTDVTVLASPDVLKDGVHTKPIEQKTEDSDKHEAETERPLLGGVRPFNSHLNLGSFFNSLGFLKNLPEPWWKGKNVCVEKSEKIEDKQNGGETPVDKHVIIMGTGTFEHCKQTSGKYICTTVMSSPQSTKTVSTTYQCCEGFRREANGCVQGEYSDGKDKDESKSQMEYLPDKDAVPQQTHQYNSINAGKSPEDLSYSSQSEEGNEETLEQWRKFKWNRLR